MKARPLNKFPNTSFLTFLTQTVESTENLLFIYLKTIPDFYPLEKNHWYYGIGKNIKPNLVWKELNIKQWSVCGKDEIISDLFNTIVNYKSIDINGSVTRINIPEFTKLQNEYDIFKDRSDIISEMYQTIDNILIPFEFFQKDNLQYLTSLKTGSSFIQPIHPFGIISKDFLFNNLDIGIWGIKEYRTPYLTFHGVKESSIKGKGSIELVGFFQNKFDLMLNYEVRLFNNENINIGEGIIELTTGFFSLILSEPVISGSIEIIKDSKIIHKQSFALLQDISFNTHIIDKVFRDNYRREFRISENKKDRPLSLKNITWQEQTYSDKNDAFSRLSDIFKSIFDYLGPEILIADPYYIGEIESDNHTSLLTLKNDQGAFFNGLIHSAIDYGISKLIIMGSWKRAKQHISSNWLDKYNSYIRQHIQFNKIEHYLPVDSIEFRNSKDEFHNRYWFSLQRIDDKMQIDKCIILTNSLGNINELDVVLVEDIEQLKQIKRKYNSLFSHSEYKITI